MRWLLWNVDWSLGNNRIHCSSGASLQATGLALEMHGRRQLPQSGLVHRPGKLVQRRGQPQRFWRGWGLRRALVDPPGDGVAWVPAAPTGLGFLSARRLAFRLPAGMLAAS